MASGKGITYICIEGEGSRARSLVCHFGNGGTLSDHPRWDPTAAGYVYNPAVKDPSPNHHWSEKVEGRLFTCRLGPKGLDANTKNIDKPYVIQWMIDPEAGGLFVDKPHRDWFPGYPVGWAIRTISQEALDKANQENKVQAEKAKTKVLVSTFEMEITPVYRGDFQEMTVDAVKGKVLRMYWIADSPEDAKILRPTQTLLQRAQAAQAATKPPPKPAAGTTPSKPQDTSQPSSGVNIDKGWLSGTMKRRVVERREEAEDREPETQPPEHPDNQPEGEPATEPEHPMETEPTLRKEDEPLYEPLLDLLGLKPDAAAEKPGVEEAEMEEKVAESVAATGGWGIVALTLDEYKEQFGHDYEFADK